MLVEMPALEEREGDSGIFIGCYGVPASSYDTLRDVDGVLYLGIF